MKRLGGRVTFIRGYGWMEGEVASNEVFLDTSATDEKAS